MSGVVEGSREAISDQDRIVAAVESHQKRCAMLGGRGQGECACLWHLLLRQLPKPLEESRRESDESLRHL